jgi:hypothetical protein
MSKSISDATKVVHAALQNAALGVRPVVPCRGHLPAMAGGSGGGMGGMDF